MATKDTINILKTERDRLAAAAKSLSLTIAMLEGDESAVAMAKPIDVRSLPAPPRNKARGNRGGGAKPRTKKKRAAPKAKPPKGTACDREPEGGCSDEFWASRGCKKCGRVQQLCGNHGGQKAVAAAAMQHGQDHRWGKVDEHGQPVERLYDADREDRRDPVGDGAADHPSSMSRAPATLSMDQL